MNSIGPLGDLDKFVSDAADDIVLNISSEDKKKLLEQPDYSRHHFGFGMYIRNHYIYSKEGGMPLPGFLADSVSHKIFDRVIELLKQEQAND